MATKGEKMVHNLQEKLFEKYPKIFAQKELSPQQTSMCWGISTGDGWYALIDDLCKKIQVYIDRHKEDQVEAIQVKEKFGGLRFYTNGGCEEISTMIYEAEAKSYLTCEDCGSKEDIGHTSGWITTLCRTCAMKDERRKKNWKVSNEKR